MVSVAVGGSGWTGGSTAAGVAAASAVVDGGIKLAVASLSVAAAATLEAECGGPEVLLGGGVDKSGGGRLAAIAGGPWNVVSVLRVAGAVLEVGDG